MAKSKNYDQYLAAVKLLRKCRRAEGLCVACPNNGEGVHMARKGRTMCGICAKKSAVRSARRFNRLKGAGLCHACGQQPAREGHGLCKECHHRHKIAAMVCSARRAKRLRDAGLCGTCGKRPLWKTHTRCKQCHLRRKKTAAERPKRIFSRPAC